LYKASQAGVSIDLIVRGICALRPGLPGLSENIRVLSVVGRFLEHSRIFYFANDDACEIFIGSADWMHRNLDRRVEAVVPIQDAGLRQYILTEILAAYLQDNENSWALLPDGSYEKIRRGDDDPKFDSQSYFVGSDIQ
jgi:polyphosphate kinase